jgi:hypothetical protein
VVEFIGRIVLSRREHKRAVGRVGTWPIEFMTFLALPLSTRAVLVGGKSGNIAFEFMIRVAVLSPPLDPQI